MDTMQLSCRLTEQQLSEKSDALAREVRAERVLDLERAAAAKVYRQRLGEVRLTIAGLAQEISTRSEVREVEIKKRVDHEAGVEETVRLDTGEVVRTRTLAPSERQGVLHFVRGDDEEREHAHDAIEG
jgi:Zn-finger domain-containing protein